MGCEQSGRANRINYGYKASGRDPLPITYETFQKTYIPPSHDPVHLTPSNTPPTYKPSYNESFKENWKGPDMTGTDNFQNSKVKWKNSDNYERRRNSPPQSHMYEASKKTDIVHNEDRADYAVGNFHIKLDLNN